MSELAWAAGFFDGEGTTYRRKNGYVRTTTKSKRKQIKEYLQLAVAQVNVEPLERFRRAVGCGNVNGPYGPYGLHKQLPYYQYFAASVTAMRVLDLLWPYLTEVKRNQAKAAGYAAS